MKANSIPLLQILFSETMTIPNLDSAQNDRYDLFRYRSDISKVYFGHWEPLGVTESCRTRIPGWWNPRVYCTDAVAFRCTWEHLWAPTSSLGAPGSTWEYLGAPATSLGVPTTLLWAPRSSGDKTGSTDHKPGSTLNHCRAVWENHHLLWLHSWCA